MKDKYIKRMFEDHILCPGCPADLEPLMMTLLWSHYSALSKLLHSIQYPRRFLDCDRAVEYSNIYFLWYNKEYLHYDIDYVIPEQHHNGWREGMAINAKRDLNKSLYSFVGHALLLSEIAILWKLKTRSDLST